jgi:MFS family permease
LLAQQQASGGLSSLGMMIIASGIAASISAPIWGKLGDRSSRLVMVLAALIAGLLGLLVFALVESGHAIMQQPLTYAALYLALIVFHSGVRLGRKVYLVDMATAETRATYVAISNTVIGVLMLFGGLIGIVGDILDLHYVILLLGLLCSAAAIYCWRLPEVSH